jgi:hypothetical protein
MQYSLGKTENTEDFTMSSEHWDSFDCIYADGDFRHQSSVNFFTAEDWVHDIDRISVLRKPAELSPRIGGQC